MNKREKALYDLSILTQDLASQLQEIDDVEIEIEAKLKKIKNLKDGYKIEVMNSELKILLDWWKEKTGYDYEI